MFILSPCWLVNSIPLVLTRYGRNERQECNNCAKIFLCLPRGEPCVTNITCVQSWIKLVWTFACFLSPPDRWSFAQVPEIKMSRPHLCQDWRRDSLPPGSGVTPTLRSLAPIINIYFSHRFGQQTSFNLKCIFVFHYLLHAGLSVVRERHNIFSSFMLSVFS